MAYLLAQDTVSGAEGSIVITVDGKNYEIAGMKNIRTEAEIQTEDMRVIGTTKIQKKYNGAIMTGTGNIYYGSNLFTDMVLDYIQRGVVTYFSLQITNADPATTIARQRVLYTDCCLTGTIPISILADDQSMLNYDFNFAVGGVERLDKFADPARLGVR